MICISFLFTKEYSIAQFRLQYVINFIIYVNSIMKNTMFFVGFIFYNKPISDFLGRNS